MAEFRSTDVLDYAKRLASGELDVEALLADESVSKHYQREILVLALYSIEYDAAQRDRRSKRQRRAMGLLRSLLSPEQCAELRRNGRVLVRGSLGNVYHLNPRMGTVWRVERHGKHWRRIATYCLHDYAEDDPTYIPSGLPDEGKRSLLPRADWTVAHLLLLSADEREFRRRANESIQYGAPLRFHWMMAQERRQLEAGAA